jgi:hypothetical protein
LTISMDVHTFPTSRNEDNERRDNDDRKEIIGSNERTDQA